MSTHHYYNKSETEKAEGVFFNFNFNNLDSPDFKEDSVREILILPLLHNLGYENSQIIRSKSLKHPFLKVGSKKRPINLVPDYLLKVKDTYAWVLDAKAPNQNIKTGDNVEQVYSYSIHPEIRTKFFALCNGRAFSLFRQDNSEPILYFELVDIASYWEDFKGYLSPNQFQSGKTFTYQTLSTIKEDKRTENFDYLNRPLLEEIPVKKQSAKRHFGVHGYFTKQTWNVVQEYIKNFSQKGDLILDPFGGSGVTAIEAMMIDRRAIHIDLNPMSVFLVDSLTCPVEIAQLQSSFEKIKATYLANEPKTNEQIENTLKKYDYPKDLTLSKSSDVEFVQDLFSKKQLAQLAFLRYLILKQSNGNVRKSLLLAFSSTITKTNLTYHNSEQRNENAGDCAAFRYYRYRLAPRNVHLDLMNSFETKFKKVVNAKSEIEYKINENTIKNLQTIKGTATNLPFLKKESVDYIYTDPPYGKRLLI